MTLVVNVRDDDENKSESGYNHPYRDLTRYTDIAATNTTLADNRYRRRS